MESCSRRKTVSFLLGFAFLFISLCVFFFFSYIILFYTFSYFFEDDSWIRIDRSFVTLAFLFYWPVKNAHFPFQVLASCDLRYFSQTFLFKKGITEQI